MLPGPGLRSRTCHRVLSSTRPSAARQGSSMGLIAEGRHSSMSAFQPSAAPLHRLQQARG